MEPSGATGRAGYTGVSLLITIGFNANADAQAGAYATGILVMMVSGAAGGLS